MENTDIMNLNTQKCFKKTADLRHGKYEHPTRAERQRKLAHTSSVVKKLK